MSIFDSPATLRERLGLSEVMSENEFFEAEIFAWKKCAKRRMMIDGERYYKGDHDIKKRERSAIGPDGRLKKIENLPNNKIVDNQYQRMVNQKVDYLLGKGFTIDSDNENYETELKRLFGKKFQRTIKCVLRDAVNEGIAWLYPYVDEAGELAFRKIPAYEILPFWKDDEHTKLDRAVRLYEEEGYRGREPYVREMVEIYSKDGVKRLTRENGRLYEEEENGHFFSGIGRAPLVAFKYNEKEIPLIERVKSLQDALNITESDLANSLQEDCRNTILVLQNYDGTDLGEFRQNLALYGAVKVRTIDGTPGDIKTLQTPLNTENYEKTISLLKSAIVENAMGYDSKSDKLGNNPNQLSIKSMYSDLDLDMSETETEFKSSFEELLIFANEYLALTGRGDFEGETARIAFDRDCIINESEIIDNCIKSENILSMESVVEKHPWVKDVRREMKRLKMPGRHPEKGFLK